MGILSRRLATLGTGTAVLLAALSANAQTNVTGGTLNDTTWTQAGSPYIVLGDVFIPAGSFLHIEAGVEVQVAGTDGQASTPDTTRVAISISGALRIDGTKADPVTIRAQTGTATDTWYGLLIRDTATEAKLSYVTLEHSINGLDVDNPLVEISACEFAENDVSGVNLLDGAAIFDRVLLRENGNYGVRVAGGNVTMTNVIAIDNGNHGFFLPGGTVTIFNSTSFSNNFHGLSCSGATVNLRNSILADNGSNGVFQDAGTVQMVTNNLFGNAGGSVSGSVTPVDMYTTDPGFTNSPAGDLTLLDSSPNVDRGIATGAPGNDFNNAVRPLDGDAANGAEHDVGAYEYVPAEMCGDAVVNLAETCDDGASNGTYGFCNATCDGVGPFCGDGNTDAPFEECDDGGTTSGDGCDANCQSESMGTGGSGGMSSGSGGQPSGSGGTGNTMMQVCLPGEQVACACPSGAQGVQTCNDDGSAYGSCTCPSDPGGDTDTESGGCDCSTIGSRSPDGAALLLLLGAALVTRRRSRD